MLKNDAIIASFLLLAFISEILIIHAHFMTGAQDLQFHWQRIEELKESIKAGNWLPQFATNQFNGVGSAVMTFYPYLTLIPIALLSFVTKSHLVLVITSIILMTFCTMLISFYSSIKVSNKVSTSFLFSIIYGMSVTHLTYYFFNFDVGTCLTLMFLPLVIFGFVQYINNNKWIQLSIGITLIIFSHVLNSLFVLVFLLIWFVINFKLIDDKKVENVIKIIITTACTTCMFWLPAMALYFGNDLRKPFSVKLDGTSFHDIFNSALSNGLSFSLNGFDIVTVTVLAILFYKRFNRTIKQMYWIAIAIIIICSTLFPWHLFQKSLGIIQFPWRLFIFPEIILDYIFAVEMTEFIDLKKLRSVLYIFSIIIVILLSFNGQKQIINMYESYPDLTTYEPLSLPHTQPPLVHPSFKLSKSSQFKNISFRIGNEDYYMYKVKPYNQQLLQGQGIYNVNQILPVNSHGNGRYTFNNNSGNNINELNLPFMDYRGESYRMYLDHHQIPVRINKGRLITLKNVNRGNHTVKIVPEINSIIRLGRIMSIIGVLLYLFVIVMWGFRWIKFMIRHKINVK